MLTYLKISSCDSFNYIMTILRSARHLKTLIIKFSAFVYDEFPSLNSHSLSFDSLTSLTLEGVNRNIDSLKRLLSLTRSLIYFKLIGSGQLLDGFQWEQLFQKHLPHLNKFELFVEHWKTDRHTVEDIETIIKSFLR